MSDAYYCKECTIQEKDVSLTVEWCGCGLYYVRRIVFVLLGDERERERGGYISLLYRRNAACAAITVKNKNVV